MTDNIMKEQQTVAVLVGVFSGADDAAEAEKSLDELDRLLDTAGGTTGARVLQSKERPDPRTVIGSGKVREVAQLCESLPADLVVFDTELSPSQIRNLENDIGHDVRVIDRSMLILDIFALHAVTGEGKTQVELAQLRYSAPRLTGQGKDMSRLGGGIGTRGPGESQLETDRRHMQRRIRSLEKELEELEKNRRTIRAARDRGGMFRTAIVGYTNAGKSTLLNMWTDAGILAQDRLFATLDPTTRQLTLPGGETVLLTDTVGFIKKLPHHLIEAFKSTLEEVAEADLLLVVIDASDEMWESELQVTQQLIEDLGGGSKPMLYLFNKCDVLSGELLQAGIVDDGSDRFLVSAKTGYGLDAVLRRMEEIVLQNSRRYTFFLPANKQKMLDLLYRNATVENVVWEADGVRVTATADMRTAGQLKDCIVSDMAEEVLNDGNE